MRSCNPHEDSSLWPYRAHHSTTTTISSNSTLPIPAHSAMSICSNARLLNSRNGAKHWEKDRARECEEIERSWDVPGKSITTPGRRTLQRFWGKPSPHPQAHFCHRRRGSAAASPSPHSQSGAGSCVKPSQATSNNFSSESALVKNSEPSSSTGGPATVPLSSNNTSKSKAKAVPNGPDGKASTLATTQVQNNGAATLIKSAASVAIVEAVHAHPNSNGLLPTTDHNKLVRFDRLIPRSWIGFGRSTVRGRRVSNHLCVLIAVASCLCPPLSHPRFPVHHVFLRDISVHVLSRDVLTCTDMY